MPDRTELEAAIHAACGRQAWSEAATLAIEGYGGEVIGFVASMTRSAADAGEVFSVFSEWLWRGLPAFRWESSFRTWAYTLARRAATRVRRDPHRRRAVPLTDAPYSAVVERVRSRTASFLNTAARDRVAALRESLSAEDRALLSLRVEQKLPWRDVARVLADDDDLSVAALDRAAATLRKRFERIKEQLRARAR